MNDIEVGTLGSEAMLSGPMDRRRDLVKRVVDSGLDHVFIADHVSFHDGTGMDGLINAATLCAMHEDLKVCVGVYLLALRHPVTVARQIASLAESAPGRLILGIGVGGEDRHEIEVCGIDPSTRGRRTDECLQLLQALASGEAVSFEGEFFQLQDARIRPAIKPRTPILIGGRSDAAIRRTLQFGDGWLAAWCTPDRFTRTLRTIDERAAGLDVRRVFRHGAQIWIGIDANEKLARERIAQGMQQFYRIPYEKFERSSPYGSPERLAEYLSAFVDAGCRFFNLMPVAASEEAAIEGIAEIRRLLHQHHGVGAAKDHGVR